MQEFFDGSGRKWAIVLNLGSAKRVLEKTGIDLLNPVALVEINEKGEIDELRSLTTRLASDDILIGEIIAALIGKQANELGLSDDELLEIFDGATLKEAHSAFLKEYNAFFTARGNYPMKMMTETMIERRKTIETEKSLEVDLEKSIGETLSELREEPVSLISTT